MFVIRSMERGGAERQLCVLAKALVARGHTVSVAVFYAGHSFERDIETGDVRVIDLRKKGRWDVVAFYVRLLRAIRREQPDVLHAYLSVANILCGSMRWLWIKVPVVLGVRASRVTGKRREWLSRLSLYLERVCARSAKTVIANSEAGRRHLGLSDADRAVVINNGIDTEYFRPDLAARTRMRDELQIPTDVRIVGLVARLDPVKDHSTFLRAAARVREHRSDVRFLCVGTINPTYLVELRRLAFGLGLGSALTWIGEKSNMADLYNALDVLCLCSHSEGFPNVLAEAMACGIPCVATDVGDCARVLSEADQVIPPRDPEALAQAIMRSLQDAPSNRELRIDRVRQHFSIAQLVDKTEQVLMRAAGATRIRPFVDTPSLVDE
jgi:glycosyltransferase involved in cell wall biosynthesis